MINSIWSTSQKATNLWTGRSKLLVHTHWHRASSSIISFVCCQWLGPLIFTSTSSLAVDSLPSSVSEILFNDISVSNQVALSRHTATTLVISQSLKLDVTDSGQKELESMDAALIPVNLFQVSLISGRTHVAIDWTVIVCDLKHGLLAFWLWQEEASARDKTYTRSLRLFRSVRDNRQVGKGQYWYECEHEIIEKVGQEQSGQSRFTAKVFYCF